MAQNPPPATVHTERGVPPARCSPCVVIMMAVSASGSACLPRGLPLPLRGAGSFFTRVNAPMVAGGAAAAVGHAGWGTAGVASLLGPGSAAAAAAAPRGPAPPKTTGEPVADGGQLVHQQVFQGHTAERVCKAL